MAQSSAVTDCPWSLPLASGETVICEQLLRQVANKRLVYLATWQQRRVIAKLFFRSAAAERYIKQELRGYHALCQQAITTPVLLNNDLSADGDYAILLYEYIEHAYSAPLDDRVLATLVKQHQGGFYQHDIHRNNYLITGDTLYCIDNASIVVKQLHQPLDIRTSLKNLAAFMVQCNLILFDERCLTLLTQYCEQRDWQVTDQLIQQCQHWFMQASRKFYFKRLNKVVRTCREFQVKRTAVASQIYRRDYECAELLALLADPESAIANARAIKRGHTCTVVKTRLNDQPIVIKRYNLKNYWHGLKRAVQTTRARRCWVNGYRLIHLGFHTPLPIAIIEKKHGRFNREAYLITQYVAATRLDQWLADPTVSPTSRALIYQQFQRLFQVMQQFRFTHGDMKPTNFLVTANNELMITDLDSLRPRSRWRLQQALRNDEQRLGLQIPLLLKEHS